MDPDRTSKPWTNGRSTPEPTSAEWHRDYEERRLAGVCAGVSAQLGVPLTLVRAAFIVGTVLPGLHFAAPAIYGALWLLMPDRPGGPSGLDRVLDAIQGLRDLGEDWADSAHRRGSGDRSRHDLHS
ncbi:MAG: PspC domain-containing protein [Myxococcota bacterium]|nr:PspC domain-containing protein [Myxococcota bacterium]